MKKVLLVISDYKEGAKPLASKIIDFLTERGLETASITYNGYDRLNSADKTLTGDFAFIISLGGDGNVLFASRLAAPRGIPVFPINLGQFGFIANIEPADWQEQLEAFLNGTQSPHIRMLLRVEVLRGGRLAGEYTALNEAVISSNGLAKLTSVDIYYKRFSFGTFRSDGIIVSTPTGSTGYSVAAGGPILDPSMKAFVVLPIAPFTLSSRPLVLPADDKIRLALLPQRQNKLILSLDGQEAVPLKIGDEVVVSQSDKSVNLVGCSQEHFYRVLRAKLSWSGSVQMSGQ